MQHAFKKLTTPELILRVSLLKLKAIPEYGFQIAPLRKVQIQASLFLKSMSERVGSDIERLRN